jgi:SAM-dependent methyltransferase
MDPPVHPLGCPTGTDLRNRCNRGTHRRSSPSHAPAGVILICGNAANLQFADESFDLVMLFECLCIMIDSATRMRMASEALRVLKPGDAILFYDFRYRRPGLGDVLRPLRKYEIKQLFPGCDFRLRSIHPFPPLSRKLAGITPAAWHLLNLVPPMRTSYVGTIKKRSPPDITSGCPFPLKCAQTLPLRPARITILHWFLARGAAFRQLMLGYLTRRRLPLHRGLSRLPGIFPARECRVPGQRQPCRFYSSSRLGRRISDLSSAAYLLRQNVETRLRDPWRRGQLRPS